MVRLVRGLGRINGWSHDYWRTIGWSEFWASVAEAELFVEHQRHDNGGAGEQEDPLVDFEASIAAATGMKSPL